MSTQRLLSCGLSLLLGLGLVACEKKSTETTTPETTDKPADTAEPAYAGERLCREIFSSRTRARFFHTYPPAEAGGNSVPVEYFFDPLLDLRYHSDLQFHNYS